MVLTPVLKNALAASNPAFQAVQLHELTKLAPDKLVKAAQDGLLDTLALLCY